MYLEKHFDGVLKWAAAVIPCAECDDCLDLLCAGSCHLQGAVLRTLRDLSKGRDEARDAHPSFPGIALLTLATNLQVLYDGRR